MVPCVCVLCDPTCILFIHWVAWLFRQGHQTTSSSVAQLLVRTEKTREAPCTYGLMFCHLESLRLPGPAHRLRVLMALLISQALVGMRKRWRARGPQGQGVAS